MRFLRLAILGSMVQLAAPVSIQAQISAEPSDATRLLANYSSAVENLAQSASPAVVQIVVKSIGPLEKGPAERAGFVTEQEATGSGVIVDPTGFILTNAHVIQNARHIEVQILKSDEKEQQPHAHLMTAKLIGQDRLVDLALLKIDAQNLPTLSFVNSDTLRQGQFVLALGSPLGLQNSVTHGVISATLRQLKPESPMVYIQTDAPINPGNSGGPLLDARGRIAGINTMIYSESGGNEGIGFAIPANLAKDVYQRLRKDGRVHRGLIGVLPVEITPRLATSLGLNHDSGVILSDVAPHGAGEAAGLQPGDIVLSIDGRAIHHVRDLTLAVFQRVPGDEITVGLQRGAQTLTLKVAIMERTNEPSQLEDLADYDSGLIRRLGILAMTVDQRVTAILPDLRRLSGVAVAAVPAEFAGLNPGLLPGDVIYSLNTTRVTTLDELKAALRDKKPGDPITLQVERSGQLIYVTSALE